MYFKIKIKQKEFSEKGVKEKTNFYLFKADTWTECEVLVAEEFNGEEYEIDVIGKSKVKEAFKYEEGSYFLEVDTGMITFDEEKGKESSCNIKYLIQADSIEQGLLRLSKKVDCRIVPYTVAGIKLTNIMEVYDERN